MKILIKVLKEAQANNSFASNSV